MSSLFSDFRASRYTPKIKTSRGFALRFHAAGGFTLVEIIATLALASILMVMSVGGYRYFTANRSLDVAASEIRTQIREGQAFAVSTGNTHRIVFSSADSSFMLERREGSDWIGAAPREELPTAVDFASSSPPDFGGDVVIEFYARGVSESGSLVLQNRNGETKTVSVDGETVNVSIS